ncbi:MAG: choice-of-anchor J domain-containing protein [Bacteroidales bacterium]|nr:choice-of-anchor J domain-containing protein [Bacteroidales bacterium]
MRESFTLRKMVTIPAPFKKRITRGIAILAILVLPSLNAVSQNLQPLPISCDFKGFTGVNLHEICPGWDEGTGYPKPTLGSGGWFESDILYPTTCAGINVYGIGKHNWIVTPYFSVTENTIVRFDAAMTLKHDEPRPSSFGSDDKFAIMVSDDGGNTYTPAFEFTATSEAQLTMDMQTFTVDLSTFAGKNVTVGFYATTGNIDNGYFALHLDDILIKDKSQVDAAVVSIVSPTPDSFLTDETPIKVIVKNDGLTPIENVPVRFKIRGAETENIFSVVSKNLAPNEEFELDFGTYNFSVWGNYSISAVTELDGDQDAANNAVEVNIVNIEPEILPLPKLDFTDSYDRINFYEGWDEARGEERPLVYMKVDWQSDKHVGTGEYGFSVYFVSLGTCDWIVSPSFIATSDAKITFDYAITYDDGVSSMGSDDKLIVFATDDNGETWNNLAEIDKNSTISETEWNKLFVDLSDYDGKTVRIALQANTGVVLDPESYVFFIDNLEVANILSHDIAPVKVVSPQTPSAFGTTETISVLVGNKGSSDVEEFEISYKIGSSNTVTEQVSLLIPAREERLYIFDTKADLSGSQSADITITTNLPNDEDASNNSLSAELSSMLIDLTEVGQYETSFENALELKGWSVLDANQDGREWFLTTVPREVFEGDYAYSYTSKRTNAPSNDWLFSPAFSMKADEEYVLSFYFRANATGFPERLRVTYSSEQNENSLVEEILDLGEVTHGQYMQATIEFAVVADGDYHLGWHIYESMNGMGLEIDNVSLHQLLDNDIKVNHIQVPRKKVEGSAQLANIDEIKVEVENIGRNSVSAFDLSIEVDGGSAITQSFTEPLMAGKKRYFSVNEGLDLDPNGIYDVKVWSSLDTDLNYNNDTIVGHVNLAEYSTSFEATDDSSEWTFEDLAGPEYTWAIVNESRYARTGKQAWKLHTDRHAQIANDDWLFSEPFYLEEGKCYKVGFWYNPLYSQDSLVFAMGDGNAAVSMTQIIKDFGSIGNGSTDLWSNYEISISVETTGSYYFGWRGYGDLRKMSRYNLYIDDFYFEEQTNFEVTADFSVLVLDKEVAFEASGENIETYSWDLGDGNTSIEKAFTNTYADYGTYDVTLVASNNCSSKEVTKQVTIVNNVDANFTYSVDNLAVTFTFTGENGVAYFWDFGDDNFSSEMEPTHTYAESGNYEVTLTVIGATGADTFSQQVEVSAGTSVPTTQLSNGGVHPNPVTDQLKISLPAGYEISKISIFNAIGKEVLSSVSTYGSNSINMGKLPSGVYIVSVNSVQGEVFTYRVVK